MTRCIPLLASLALACAFLAGCWQGPGTAEDAARAVADLIGADDTACTDDRKGADDLGAADEQLRAALARWPSNARLRELQGDLDLRRGYGVRAQAAFERAIRGDPRNRGLQVKLTRALLVQERYREALALAVPADGDPQDVIAGLGLVRLEAELALGPRYDLKTREEAEALHDLETREQAEALWRLVAGGDAGLVKIRACLERLATRVAAVEAGRQRARCRPVDELASLGEPGMPPGVPRNDVLDPDAGADGSCGPAAAGDGAGIPLPEPDGATTR